MKDDAILIQCGASHPPTDAESAPNPRTKANSRFLLRVEAPQPHQFIIPGMPISVTGFALAAQPLKEIVVTLGKAIAFAKFGSFRPDLAAAFRDNHADVRGAMKA
jgi:hypothetical protein